jgi:Photosynthesis system II assembly factor YCF48
MNKFPNIVRARLSALKAGDHPDPDLLTAFAEQALAEQERSTVLAHLSRCSDCREVLAVAMPSLSAVELAAASSIDTALGHSWFRGHALRWAAAATCVVIVGSAVLMKRDLMMKQAAKTVAIREDSTSAELANYAAADRADKTEKKQLPMARSQPALPAESDRDQETRQQKVLPSTQVDDAKKALALEPTPPSAAPAVAGRMRAEFAPSAIDSGAAGGGAAGVAAKLAPAPSRNESSAILSLNENKIEKKAASSEPAAASPEQIQVTAAVPLLEAEAAGSREKQELPGKAKAPSGIAMYDALVSAPSQQSSDQTVLAKEAARRAEMKRVETIRPPVARWTISSDGQLQHSVDSGKTWQAVVVAENATFRALSANGPDLWVGGASGLLYHSTDAGTHWTQVKPATADATLTADIAAIEFVDVRQGKITTSTGEVWITADGGQTWRKQS